ncbi:MAG: hypothetical protein HRT37_12435 [Alteromonadaceae bacterium]|nr:hypothetical protein [Alteromonadaceae bacterium]
MNTYSQHTTTALKKKYISRLNIEATDVLNEGKVYLKNYNEWLEKAILLTKRLEDPKYCKFINLNDNFFTDLIAVTSFPPPKFSFATLDELQIIKRTAIK